ncbi:hypothetical protein GPS63_04345 [Acinetobacter haemolyticus]|uniref:hypothetical protein n=1 Tax=Acinetobacter haemolyticus TaxID=29430 RepID=UPI001331E53C|nr:hypothetical protein [Acinetobacter haemolyticus]NAR17542.1 hypothetical protein [Acinetobacter haemolyticus]NAR37013.1 hypothetical protein [Acinetobacter haemolyticus]NAR48280.1 hypothetical protein [Acinetobacter haemolyticus]QHI18557.1 hypothetical protein AhaeAN3_00560 [Acinetobacter haemolyticus]
MDNFDLKIRYLHHIDLKDVDQFEALNTIGVLTRFDRMAWKQLLSRWLQLDGATPTFTITDGNTEHTIEIILNTYSSSQELSFIVKTDIAVVVPKKQVFGLITFQAKERIHFNQISLAQVKTYLTAFLKQDTDTLVRYYQQSKQLAC